MTGMIPAARPGLLGRLPRPAGPFWIAVALLAICAVFGLLRPAAFPTAFNFTNIAISAAIILVVAVGQTFVIATAGIDLSVGSVLVFSSVTGGAATLWLTEAVGGADSPGIWAAVLGGMVVALLSGAAWGALNGVLIAVARIPAMIVTLGSLGMALGLAQIMTRGNDLRGMPAALRGVASGRLFEVVPFLVLIAVAVAVVFGLVLRTTRFGRYTLAIGSDEEAARRNGIRVRAHLVKVYVLIGLLAGLAGWLSLARFGGTTINGYPSANLDSIAAVVLGGTSLFGGVATMIGTAVGVLIPAVLENGFTIAGVEPFWQDVAVGAVLIAAVYFDLRRRRERPLLR